MLSAGKYMYDQGFFIQFSEMKFWTIFFEGGWKGKSKSKLHLIT